LSSLLNELKQSRPFRLPGLEASVALLRTTAHLRRLLEADLGRHGITLQQFNVLRILRGAGEAVPTMDSADRMVEQEPGITRLLGRLESKGLIERRRCADDGRRVLVGITTAGIEVLDQVGDPTDFLGHEADSAMSTADLDTLIELLDKARKAMEPF
jgi:DNA-binding MarR family transcriptional regulator